VQATGKSSAFPWPMTQLQAASNRPSNQNFVVQSRRDVSNEKEICTSRPPRSYVVFLRPSLRLTRQATTNFCLHYAKEAQQAAMLHENASKVGQTKRLVPCSSVRRGCTTRPFHSSQMRGCFRCSVRTRDLRNRVQDISRRNARSAGRLPERRGHCIY